MVKHRECFQFSQWEICFCITIFVNEIPDVLLGLSLLVFSSHFENELSLDQEYFRVKIGVAAKSILLRRLEATSWLHRKEGCNYLSMSTFDQLSVPCGHLIEQQWYICWPFSRIQYLSYTGLVPLGRQKFSVILIRSRFLGSCVIRNIDGPLFMGRALWTFFFYI